MPALTIAFSEQEVQAELERIANEHVQRNQYDTAAAAYEQLAADYPESKWLGNILLLAALCYRELAQPERETEILQRFLAECPNHPQTPAAQRALERVSTHYSEQAPTGDLVPVIEQLQGRVSAVSAALQQMQGNQSRVEQVAITVDHLSKRLGALELSEIGGLLGAAPEGAEVTPIEMLGSVVQDLSAEAEALRQRVDDSLEALTREIAEFRAQSRLTRFSWTFAGVAVLVSLLSLTLVMGSLNLSLSKRVQSAMRPERALRAQAAPLPATRPGVKQPRPDVTAAPEVATKAAAHTLNAQAAPLPATHPVEKRLRPDVTVAPEVAPKAAVHTLNAQVAPLPATHPGVKRPRPDVTVAPEVAPKFAARNSDASGLDGQATPVKTEKPNLSKTKPPVRPQTPKAAKLSAKRGSVYTIKAGDTLFEVCKKHIGSTSPKTIRAIAAMNNLSPPYDLRAGNTLRFPK